MQVEEKSLGMICEAFLTVLASQHATVNVERLLCENKACSDSVPGGLGLVLPSMKMVLSDNAGYGWLSHGFTIY
jgi:hypothetical protein